MGLLTYDTQPPPVPTRMTKTWSLGVRSVLAFHDSQQKFYIHMHRAETTAHGTNSVMHPPENLNMLAHSVSGVKIGAPRNRVSSSLYYALLPREHRAW